MTERTDGRGAAPGRVEPLLFDELASEHGPRLLRAAWFLCRDRDAAEDLVQETFFEALQSASRFEGRAAPYTWLYGIMRRRFLLICRKKRRFAHWLGLAGSSLPDSGTAAIERDERLDPVMRSVLALPLKHREVLLLRYIDGRKIADIAGLLRISEGTVKSRLHHALRKTRTAIGIENEPPAVPAVENAHEL